MGEKYRLQMLIAYDKSWILTMRERDRYGVVCAPHAVGQHLLDFVNEDFSELTWTGGIIDEFLHRLDDAVDENGSFADTEKLQNLTLRLISKLEDTRASGGLLQAYVQKLLNFENALYFELSGRSRDRLRREIEGTLSDLQELLPFQMKLKDALSKITSSGRNIMEYTEHGTVNTGKLSNEQMLWRVFQDFPDLVRLCVGGMGYTVINVDDNNEIIEEMLDLPMTNAFNLVLKKHPEELREDSIKSRKLICEYHEITDIRRIILIDLIEALRRGLHFSRCETCGKFFFSEDRRQTYCGDPACSTGVERMRNYQRRHKSDPYLKEAYRYKNAMASRRERTVNPGRTENKKHNRRAKLKPLSDTEYFLWCGKFHDEVEQYRRIKEGHILSNDGNGIDEAAGRRLLDAIRPEGYVSYIKKEESR